MSFNLHQGNLRDKTLLDPLRVEYATGHSTSKYARVKDWNSLPPELRDITSLAGFN